MTSNTPSHPWENKMNSDQRESEGTRPQGAEMYESQPSSRTIQGATSEGPAIPADALTLATKKVEMPECPIEMQRLIDDASLEQLIYWKLQGLFDKFDEEPPKNILKTVLAHVERPLFALVLKKTRGNQSKAAEVLGCNRNTLHRKLKGFAIQPRDLRRALKMTDRRSNRSSMEADY